MSINLQQIDELRKRANVSYEDAKNALEQSSGNLIEALVDLEKQNKIKPENIPCSESKFFNKIKSLIKKGNKAKFLIKKEDTVVLNICLNIAIIITIVATPLVIVGLIFALVTNHKIRIKKSNDEDSDVNKIFDKMSDIASKVSVKITKEMKSE